jgi:2-succinyl-6-hydroxy-2,4-cyclohexadiene-1-carboxylate synthase
MMFSLQGDYSYQLHALHGFLGSPDDWYSFGFARKDNFCTVDLFKDLPIIPFVQWAGIFNRRVAVGSNNASNHILMGYSLGGRLGLHALLQNPKQWKAAIFISTHPGLKLIEERQSRRRSDKQWAEKFEHESWDSLMERWNAQAVFKPETAVKRLEAAYSRQLLSSALVTWSLGVQHVVTPELCALDKPILWMVGAEDIKFLQEAQQLRFKHPHSRLCVISGAGHRIPWDQTESYLLNVMTFIQNLEQCK